MRSLLAYSCSCFTSVVERLHLTHAREVTDMPDMYHVWENESWVYSPDKFREFNFRAINLKLQEALNIKNSYPELSPSKLDLIDSYMNQLQVCLKEGKGPLPPPLDFPSLLFKDSI